ncbi:predicted protein [Histoplasma capsulatum H143]|uniref:Uncharacterized protein n=1 Tax=Ajellomyces capsulatus (strain H143) TaxID=544712 RepID=C6HPK2_AJECH|nr:predicted protein [Histoplasma capsulatum H143]
MFKSDGRGFSQLQMANAPAPGQTCLRYMYLDIHPHDSDKAENCKGLCTYHQGEDLGGANTPASIESRWRHYHDDDCRKSRKSGQIVGTNFPQKEDPPNSSSLELLNSPSASNNSSQAFRRGIRQPSC